MIQLKRNLSILNIKKDVNNKSINHSKEYKDPRYPDDKIKRAVKTKLNCLLY